MNKTITKQEFDQFLNQYNKEPGEYTDEELYDIGIKYKLLPTSEKRWNELVKILEPKNENGDIKTGEQFRIWLKGRQLADGTLEKNITLISGQTINDIEFSDFKDQTEEIKRDLYKQQIKTKDVLNAYRQTLRDEARIESLKDCIAASVEMLPKLPAINYTGEINKDTCEAVLMLSDLHLGCEIDSFYNKYNVNIARNRVKKVVIDTINTCKRHGVKRLTVLQLGDMISGNIHVTNRILNSEDVINQIKIASQIIAEALNELQGAAPEIIYRSCTDNHSRVTSNYKEHIEKENFQYLIDWYLEVFLKDTKIKFAKDNLESDLGKFNLLNGKVVMYSHGHRDNLNSVVQNYMGATHEFVDYICLGHYHESKLKSFQGTKVFVNSSIVGTEHYAYSRRYFGIPEQSLLLFENDNIICNYINLSNCTESSPSR